MMGFAVIPQSSAQYDGVDNNNNGVIDEPNESFKLGLVTYYNNNIGANPPPTTNPDINWDYYNYMSGRWKDSSYFVPMGTAYNPTANINPTKFVYTGDVQTNTGWTETTAGNIPGDRRLMCTIGPFNFPAKKKVEFEYAMVYSCDTSLNNVTNNLHLLQRDVRNTKHFVGQQNTACAPVSVIGLKELAHDKLKVWAYPNPATNEININLDRNAKNARISIYDVSGRAVMETIMSNSYTKTINIASLSSGIYLVEVSDGRTKSTTKIIKN
jgi:hypothetical protein